MSAFDLSQFNGRGAGPRETAAMMNELETVVQTREIALRRAAELEQVNDGYSRALSVLVDLYGEDDGNGKKFVAIPAERFMESVKRVVAFSLDPGRATLHLVNTYRYDGRWKIEKAEPTEEDKAALPWFEEKPEFLTVPGSMRAIIRTKRGLRAATWEPE